MGDALYIKGAEADAVVAVGPAYWGRNWRGSAVSAQRLGALSLHHLAET